MVGVNEAPNQVCSVHLVLSFPILPTSPVWRAAQVAEKMTHEIRRNFDVALIDQLMGRARPDKKFRVMVIAEQSVPTMAVTGPSTHGFTSFIDKEREDFLCTLRDVFLVAHHAQVMMKMGFDTFQPG